MDVRRTMGHGINHDYLLAGTWSECAYRQDRVTDGVEASAQQNFPSD